MFRWLPLFLLAACATVTPHFRGVPATRVKVADSVFDVRVRGNLAEAIRVNRQYAPRLGPIRERAGVAMAQVSGCEVIEVLGDAAVTTGVLGCDREAGEWLLKTIIATPRYDCIENSAWVNAGPGPNYAEFECYPY
ncbi:MAG: hypothetical protein AB3N21_11025 [Ruegeria sp.]|uniref:hypothetical protein n=1 Tax=Ruegeria sp. TaxID=1879320 RepID=UPI00349EEB1B